MCDYCRAKWDSYGRPDDWTADVQRAVKLIDVIYEEESTGGPLHVVLDDWNITGVIEPWDSPDFSPEVLQAAHELAKLFNGMPERLRAAALAYADGFVPIPAT